MNAIILAAGRGERLGEITQTLPKPMVRHLGKPVLQHNIELCRRSGIREICINLYHLPEVIRDYFGDGAGFGVNISYSVEQELLGTSGAVKNIARQSPEFTRQPFFVLYGDNYSNFNLSSLELKMKETDALGVVGFHYREDVSTSGVAEFDIDGRIISFVEKPTPGETNSHWVNAGIYLLNPAILDDIPDGNSDFARNIFPEMLNKKIPLYGVCDQGDVKAFDTPEMMKNNLI
ncbi:MAG: nucleotidyltransferase family protein [Bacteroidales bacterium]|nr:nucleotidyltransferase family protein [Bacteroidales bacterium]